MPAMEDGDLKTTESAAILTYLSNKHEVAEHWYSRILKLTGTGGMLTYLANEYEVAEHWYPRFHGSVRKGVTSLVIEKVLFEPFGLTSNEVCAQKYLDTTKKALNTLEDIFLANNKFVAGDEISVADLMVASEIEQLCIMKKEPTGTCMAELLEPYPKIRAWMKTVAESCAPHYDATHEGIRMPAMVDGDLKITESAAILAYLANKHKVAEHWYPRSDIKARARMDAVMHWFHGSVRKGVSPLVVEKVLFGAFGLTPNEVCAQKYLDATKKSLSTLEDIFLAKN
eukprot:gene27505-31048_t